MSKLTIGVIGKSGKENEKRVPIHPEHLDWIQSELYPYLYFESGYGEPFGVPDETIRAKNMQVVSREEIFQCDMVLLPKPVLADFEAMKSGGILWGWPHCVQQQTFTQISIDKKLTLIAWEAMHKWNRNGSRQMHIFYKNNEMAGYCAVLDALRLTGMDGFYGRPRRVAVISLGSVSRGAIYALKGRGFTDITVYTRRPSVWVADQVIGVQYRQFYAGDDGRLKVIDDNHNEYPLIDDLETMDIIVNGILQDTDNPVMFVHADEIHRFPSGSLIIDVSCDLGMGFPFARPTSFENPTFTVGGITYYAVDHTPSYLWDSASREISKALLPYLPVVIEGHEAWDRDETIHRAIEIREGVIQNPKILSFQHRSPEYPHPIVSH